jgi:nitroreductase
LNVSDALRARTSIRAFLDRPVASSLIRELLESANFSPSGGNIQPWRIYVINGPVMPRFLAHLGERTEPEEPAYDVYPPKLKEPYRSSRYRCGEDMYALLGIPREDRPARLRQLERNFRFFDAPAALFCFVDRIMGPPQWSDLGMFLQSFMLAATEAGLSTCAQECWATRPAAVTDFVEAPPELTLFCGMSVGYADPDAAVNRLRTDREPLDTWATFLE